MEIYVYYVMWSHADTHVLCNIHEDMHVLCITYTWRYQVAVQRKVFDEVEAQLDIESDTDINNAKPPKSRMSLQHTVSKFMTTWNGPMVEFYSAQQKALGHVVEGMRLCFQLRGQIRWLVNVFEPWGREAMVLPPSLVDSSEPNQSKLHCATRPTQTKTPAYPFS